MLDWAASPFPAFSTPARLFALHFAERGLTHAHAPPHYPHAILGMSIFCDEAPTEFRRFDRALVTVFQISAGKTSSKARDNGAWQGGGW